MKSKTRHLFSGAMVGLLLCGGVAQAQSIYGQSETVTVPGSRFNDDTISERVSYSDLDLSRMRDYRRLETRIERTAFRLCDVVQGTQKWNLDQKMTCTRASVHDAMAQVRPLRAHRVAYVAPAYVGPTFDD